MHIIVGDRFSGMSEVVFQVANAFVAAIILTATGTIFGRRVDDSINPMRARFVEIPLFIIFFALASVASMWLAIRALMIAMSGMR